MLQNSNDNMLRNSVSVDVKVCASELKQKSTASVFHGILRNARKATFTNKGGGAGGEVGGRSGLTASEKKIEEEK